MYRPTRCELTTTRPLTPFGPTLFSCQTLSSVCSRGALFHPLKICRDFAMTISLGLIAMPSLDLRLFGRGDARTLLGCGLPAVGSLGCQASRHVFCKSFVSPFQPAVLFTSVLVFIRVFFCVVFVCTLPLESHFGMWSLAASSVPRLPANEKKRGRHAGGWGTRRPTGRQLAGPGHNLSGREPPFKAQGPGRTDDTSRPVGVR